MLKKLLFFVLSIIILVSALCGCAEKRPDGADGTFAYPLSAEPVTLDPQVCTDSSGLTVIRAIFEGLTRLDENGEAIPGTAKSWEHSADYTVYTFHLKEDSLWYGTGVDEDIPLTASDFVFAWRRAADPETGSPLASRLFCIKNAQAVSEGTLPPEALGVTASGDHTLTVTMEYSCPDFPKIAASSAFMPCNEEFFYGTNGKYGISNNALLTNGPFRFSGYYAWEPYTYLELTASPTYMGDSDVWPAALNFSIGEAELDLSDPVALLLDQTLQACPLSSAEEATKARLAGLTTFFNENTVCGLVFNTNDKLMQHESLRRAFLGTVDRSLLTSNLPRNTTSITADDIISPQLQLAGQSYRSLVESSLYFKGDPALDTARGTLAQLEMDTFPSVSVLCEDDEQIKGLVNQLIISWNDALGNYFNIEPVSSGELSSRVLSGDYQIALWSVSSFDGTPAGILSKFASDSYSNPAGLSDPAYDALAQAAAEGDAGACLAAEKYLNDHCIFYPIYYSGNYYGFADGVSGIGITPYSSVVDFTKALRLEED